jgi:hypothetical protein
LKSPYFALPFLPTQLFTSSFPFPYQDVHVTFKPSAKLLVKLAKVRRRRKAAAARRRKEEESGSDAAVNTNTDVNVNGDGDGDDDGDDAVFDKAEDDAYERVLAAAGIGVGGRDVVGDCVNVNEVVFITVPDQVRIAIALPFSVTFALFRRHL